MRGQTLTAKVEIYSRKHCAYTQRVKTLLLIKEVDFAEHDITDMLLVKKEITPPQEKHFTPEIFIDGVLIGGCDELFNLDERGELDRLLGLTFNFDGLLPSV